MFLIVYECIMARYNILKPFKPLFHLDNEPSSPDSPDSWLDFEISLEPPEKALYLTRSSEWLLQVGRESGIERQLSLLGYSHPVIKVSTESFVSRLTISDLSLLTDDEKENHENFVVKENNYLIDIMTRPYKLKYHQLNAYQSLLRLSDPLVTNERIDDQIFSPSKCAETAEFIKTQFPVRPKMTKQEWVCLQDPKAEFSQQKPRLPGQRHPGLGIGNLFFTTLNKLVAEKNFGMFFTAEHFHNAVMYSKSGAKFASPLMEGYFRALTESLKPLITQYSLSAISWGIGEGRVVDEDTGRPVVYLAQEQLAPIEENIVRYISSAQYKSIAEEAYVLGRARKLRLLE
ncbi:hypothetical protein SmJEL517_g01319 [Synchytrium microbalum]|uniref:Uncharacterized protein n=1 Tax=Synchytrium microbalum TaxID=1806994 RepID=A0A507CBG0_9FUNG|nr:uncharacterized protein SmJEL517_g01319 [Synchytrium microbalum]TPX36489.1 hypothetical protein SmJEL517_g01319 [Synchytrium microbalum]